MSCRAVTLAQSSDARVVAICDEALAIAQTIGVLSGDGIDVTIDQSIPSPQERIAARLEDFVTMAFHTSSSLIPATTLFSNATFTVSEITRAISHPSTRNI